MERRREHPCIFKTQAGIDGRNLVELRWVCCFNLESWYGSALQHAVLERGGLQHQRSAGASDGRTGEDFRVAFFLCLVSTYPWWRAARTCQRKRRDTIDRAIPKSG
jgi:hypothetical protein